MSETIFPELRNDLTNIVNRKPDIYVINEMSKECILIEISVCYDLYLDYAYEMKVRYEPLVQCLRRNGYVTNLYVLCFGSLGAIRNNVWKSIKGFIDDKNYVKSVLKWCSISNIIGSNYIWRHRVKKLLA